jgi:hypothetical protein
MRLAAGLAYAAFGATFASHTVGALVVVLVPATVVLIWVLTSNRPPTTRKLDRAHLPWLVWALAFGVWELLAFLMKDLTISLMMDPVLEIYPLRVAGWALWLWAGWLLVRR